MKKNKLVTAALMVALLILFIAILQYCVLLFYVLCYKDKTVDIDFKKDLWVLALRKPIWKNTTLVGSVYPKFVCFSDGEMAN